MKNKTAFIFILISNLVLLAHAVIPHHHHAEAPITVAVECSHHEEHTHHENIPVCNDNHEHDETAPCILTTTLFSHNNQLKTSTPFNIASSDILFFSRYVFDYSIFIDNSYYKTAVIGNIPLYSKLLVSSQGLRAPPVC